VKLKHILKMLVCLIVMTGIASASSEGFDLNVYNHDTGQIFNPYDYLTVHVSYDTGGTVITIQITDKTNNIGRMDKVGFILPPFTDINAAVKGDDSTENWEKMNNNPHQMSSFGGNYYEFMRGGASAKTVTITFNQPIPNTPVPKIVVHAAWGIGSNFLSYEPQTPIPQLPEFPTIVLPVAAILGLMLILGRRNKE